ncbi:PepSY-associated TM helix domain-containing protein [Marinimicrobium agarilyticum]|uniref:PepSY-associated TM helix domain-containing protein n=1 Tax=Marinimicrobium agarilyticum TaxID=306546 RepID=UPI0004092837|nr:PepSY-associated TM helix domain-containing protein [Marinimicrobium agarilyticum]
MAQHTTVDDLPKGGFRQCMAWVHTWAGLSFGWLLFFMFVTGTAGYFDTEIDRWMQPELPPAPIGHNVHESASVLLNKAREEAPGAEQWLFTLPVDRNEPYAQLFWRGANTEAGASAERGERLVDLNTGETLQARETGGGQKLYQMHWLLHYTSRAYTDWIVATATLFMFVALITGVIIHRKIFKDFFTFRPRKGQRSWLDAHNVLSVTTLPFQLMITYSGLIFLGFSYMPLIVAANYGADGAGRTEFYGEVFSTPGLTEPAEKSASLIPLTTLIDQAESRWGEGRIRRIDVRHPGDANARIVVSENIDQTIASGAGRLVFDGVSGELLHNAPSASSPAKGVRDAFLGLHEGLFAPPVVRWLYFISGLLGTGMVGTGLILWAVKRRQNAERKRGSAPLGVVLVEKLNVGTVVGLPVGVAAYFWANRLLPVDLATRASWEAHAMFLTWLVMLVHAAIRPRQRAWTEQLVVAALAFSALPILNALTTDRHLVQSLTTGDWVFAGFDLTVLAIGVPLGATAWRMHRAQRKRRIAEESQPSQTQRANLSLGET